MRTTRIALVGALMWAGGLGCNALLGIEEKELVAGDGGASATSSGHGGTGGMATGGNGAGGAHGGAGGLGGAGGSGGGMGGQGGQGGAEPCDPTIIPYCGQAPTGGSNAGCPPPDAPKCEPNVNLSIDPHNCGTCGHDCLGGACDGGKCKRVTVVKSGGDALGPIAVDGAQLYWAEQGGYSCAGDFLGVRKMPLAGCAVSGAIDALGSGYALRPDGDVVFEVAYKNGWTLSKLDFTTATASPLATVPAYTRALAADANYVYWHGGGEIARVGKSGGVPETILGGLSHCSSLAIDETHAYFACSESAAGKADGTISRVPKQPNASPEPLANGISEAGGLALGSEGVYFIDALTGVVGRVPAAGGAVETLVSGRNKASSPTLSDGYVWWIEAGGIARLPRCGGAVEFFSAQIPQFIVADAHGAFLVDITDTIFRFAD